MQQSQAGYDDAVATEIQDQRLLATSYEQLREIIGDVVTDLAGPTDELPLLSPDPASPGAVGQDGALAEPDARLDAPRSGSRGL